MKLKSQTLVSAESKLWIHCIMKA